MNSFGDVFFGALFLGLLIAGLVYLLGGDPAIGVVFGLLIAMMWMDESGVLMSLRSWWTEWRRSEEPHIHSFTIDAEIIAPVGPSPQHTKFRLLICPCGAVKFFPHSNYLLVLPEWREKFVRRLHAQKRFVTNE